MCHGQRELSVQGPLHASAAQRQGPRQSAGKQSATDEEEQPIPGSVAPQLVAGCLQCDEAAVKRLAFLNDVILIEELFHCIVVSVKDSVHL